MSITTATLVAQQPIAAYQNLIGGRWQPASDGRTIDMIIPSDGQTFAGIARGTKADVDAAVNAARDAFWFFHASSCSKRVLHAIARVFVPSW